MLSAKNTAEVFIEIADSKNSPITHLKLQKLLYYAQGWHLAMNGVPLFDNVIEAWEHGPVCPSVYAKYSHYSYHSIDASAELKDFQGISSTCYQFIEKIWNMYGAHSGKSLEEMTHNELPWHDTFDGSKNKTIPIESMKSFFLLLLKLDA